MFKKILAVSTTVLMGLMSSAALGAYPDRPIKIINPFPGGPTDTMARLIAKKLQEGLGQPVVVESKGGAGGNIAVTYAARSEADGYTLLVTSATTHVVQPVIRKSLPYDADKDFIPVMIPGQSTCVIVVNASVPVTTFQELVKYAKDHPDKLTYASAGTGTALHLAGEVFSHYANVKLLHIPYKSAAQASTDLLAGQVNMMFDSPTNSAPNIKSGKLRGLAIMQPTRWATLSEIPTTTELGRPEIAFSNWLGLFALAGTPPEIIEKITAVLQSKMMDSDVKEYFQTIGMPLDPKFGKDTAKIIHDQRTALAKVVKGANLPLID